MVVVAMAFGVYHKNMLKKGGLLAPLLTHGDDAGIGMAVGLAARWLQPILSSVRLSLASTARRYPEKPGGFFNLAGQLWQRRKTCSKTCSLYICLSDFWTMFQVPWCSMMFHGQSMPIWPVAKQQTMLPLAPEARRGSCIHQLAEFWSWASFYQRSFGRIDPQSAF